MFGRPKPKFAEAPHLLFFNEEAFVEKIAESSTPIAVFKDAIAGANTQWDNRFREGESIRKLVSERSDFMDSMLRHAWNQYQWDDRISLIAVGGYGRGELHPASDIDILILTSRKNAARYKNSIESFLAFLWDIQLQVGHSVRSINECASLASRDLTIATNLLESRTIVGDRLLRRELNWRMRPEKVWPAEKFFDAKFQEQLDRHAKHGIDEYDMEPNVKESPGGLRDIQTINWVTKRYFKVSGLEELANQGFYTEEEYNSLRSGEYLLWQIRYGLHLITDRAQDKLLFDHQRQLAEMFGFRDTDEHLGVEKFMQRYYCTVMSLREINDVLMQHLREIIHPSSKAKIEVVNERFELKDGYLGPRDSSLFANQPSAMLEIFILLAGDSSIQGIQASAIRQLREYGYLIDDAFRNNPENKRLFIKLLQTTENLSIALQKMSRYAILGRYLPEFGKIIGQPQHDLFHVYPVDVHTLHVMTNIRDFGYEESHKLFPLSSRIYSGLKKPELLLIAGLYHDIGKGRGGDHSELGAVDVYRFAESHGFSKRNCELLAWLVEGHLTMSRISQREDISDPEVINNFAKYVQTQERLELLYALTVADIRGTNPDLWNGWRASLLRQLFHETSTALRRGLETTIDRSELVTETKQAAMELLQDSGFDPTSILDLWSTVADDYFQREFPNDIAWQTETILNNPDLGQPVVAVKTFVLNNRDRATELLVCTHNSDNVFAAVANAIDQLGYNIQDARLYSTETSTWDMFYLLDDQHRPIPEGSPEIERLKSSVLGELEQLENYDQVIKMRTPRRLKHFPVPTETSLTQLDNASLLEVVTADRPGLLATIGRIFIQYNIRLHSAKISTLGERVEDLFTITDRTGQPIHDAEFAERLQRSIRETIDQQVVELQS